MNKIDAPGVYDNLTSTDYHSGVITPSPALSSAIAVAMIEKCPRAAWYEHPALNPNFETTNKAQYDRGSAAHSRILEPGKFADAVEIILAPDYKTQRARDLRDAAYAMDKTPLLEHQLGEVMEMADVLQADPVASVLINNGFPERSHFWQDQQTGIWCKCRPDYLVPHQRATTAMQAIVPWTGPQSFIVNYKTHGGSIDPVSFARHVAEMGYVQRAAWEMEGVLRTTGEFVDHYLIIAQEIEPPYLVATYELVRNDLEYGGFFNRVAISEFARCLARGTEARHWPGYRTTEDAERDIVMPLELPVWKRQRTEEQRLKFVELGKKRRAAMAVGQKSAEIAPYFAP